jgi:hypothetical protein
MNAALSFSHTKLGFSDTKLGLAVSLLLAALGAYLLRS